MHIPQTGSGGGSSLHACDLLTYTCPLTMKKKKLRSQIAEILLLGVRNKRLQHSVDGVLISGFVVIQDHKDCE